MRKWGFNYNCVNQSEILLFSNNLPLGEFLSYHLFCSSKCHLLIQSAHLEEDLLSFMRGITAYGSKEIIGCY